MKKYFDILGISPESNPEEIKKAYKKKALQFHPDKNNGDDTEFKKINEAYKKLTGNEINGNEFNFNFFENLFNVNEKSLKQIKINLTLEEVFTGITKIITLDSICDSCKKNCVCKGSQTIIKQMGPFSIQVPCNDCKKNCNCIPNKKIKLQIPQNIKNNELIKYNNILFFIEIKQHPLFQRNNNNLLLNLKITFKETLTGKKFKIKMLDLNILEIDTSCYGVVDPQEMYCIKNKGLKNGDLFISFKVLEYPKKLNPEIIKILNK